MAYKLLYAEGSNHPDDFPKEFETKEKLADHLKLLQVFAPNLADEEGCDKIGVETPDGRKFKGELYKDRPIDLSRLP